MAKFIEGAGIVLSPDDKESLKHQPITRRRILDIIIPPLNFNRNKKSVKDVPEELSQQIEDEIDDILYEERS